MCQQQNKKKSNSPVQILYIYIYILIEKENIIGRRKGSSNYNRMNEGTAT